MLTLLSAIHEDRLITRKRAHIESFTTAGLSIFVSTVVRDKK